MPSKQITNVVTPFVKSNAWILGTSIALFAVTEFRNILLQNIVFATAILVLVEISLAIYLIYCERSTDYHIQESQFDLSWHVEALEIRFCVPQDSFGTESVYEEWFPDDVAIDDSEYDLIVSRGGFVRVIEADMKKGGREEKAIVGYYSIFPISMATYDKMRTGKLKEMDLKNADVLDPSDPNARVLYIPEICESRGRNVGPALVRDLLRYTAYIINNNLNIQIIAAWPYTKYGKRLISDFKMKPAPGKRFWQKIYYMTRESAATNRLPSSGFKDRRRIQF